MSLKGTTVTPDKRKGLVYVQQTDDSLIHFCWKDRTSGSVEDVSVSARTSSQGLRLVLGPQNRRMGAAQASLRACRSGLTLGGASGPGVVGLLPSGAVRFAHGPS